MLMLQIWLTLYLLPQPSDGTPNSDSTGGTVKYIQHNELSASKLMEIKNMKGKWLLQLFQKKKKIYFNVYAPPALTLPQSLQPQMPTAFLFTAYCIVTCTFTLISESLYSQQVRNKLWPTNYLPTKFTEVFSMLAYFHLFYLLPQTSTISCAWNTRAAQFCHVFI